MPLAKKVLRPVSSLGVKSRVSLDRRLLRATALATRVEDFTKRMIP